VCPAAVAVEAVVAVEAALVAAAKAGFA